MEPRPSERAVTIALDESSVLEGIYLAGTDEVGMGAVVAPPFPLMGGSMDHPVVSEIAYACSGGGLSALRFNWRGVGGSPGVPSGRPEVYLQGLRMRYFADLSA